MYLDLHNLFSARKLGDLHLLTIAAPCVAILPFIGPVAESFDHMRSYLMSCFLFAPCMDSIPWRLRSSALGAEVITFAELRFAV
jgi:hypothetical protein